MNNVTISGQVDFYRYLTGTITKTVFATIFYLHENASVTVMNSSLYDLEIYDFAHALLQNVTFTHSSSHLYLYNSSSATLINSTLDRIITRDTSLLSLNLHSVSMSSIRIYDLSSATGTIENSSVTELNVYNNGTAIIDAAGNTNFTQVAIYNFGYLELSNAYQIGTAYIDKDAYYKPLLSGNITLIRSNLWINGVATLDNMIPSGSYSIFARGTFTINELNPWIIYLNDSDKLTLTATNVAGGIILYDNSEITINGTLSVNTGATTYGVIAYNNSKVVVLSDVGIYQSSYFYDNAFLNISGVPHKSSFSTLYLFNSSSAWIRNATISNMYVSGTGSVQFASYENAGVGPLNETITLTNLYVAPFVLTDSGLIIDPSITHNPIITSMNQGEQYLTISSTFEGYNLRITLYDAKIYVMYLDNVTAGYLNNVSFTSGGQSSGVGMVYDFFDSYFLEPAFFGNVTLENCTANYFYTISSKPTVLVNSTINNLGYAYLVNDTHTLTLNYDTNITEILNSGTGYVTYTNVTSTINTLVLATLGAIDNGHLIIKNEYPSYSLYTTSTYTRASSTNWSGTDKTHFYIEYDYTQYGLNHLSVSINCNDDNITWARIDVMAADGSWHTIVNDTFETSAVTLKEYSFENFTDIFGSLAYKVRVWVNVSDSTSASYAGYVSITREYNTGLDNLVMLYVKDNGLIDVNKAEVSSMIFLQDNAQLNVLETSYVGAVIAFETSHVFVNNTVTNFNCPYLENQTKRGIDSLYLMEHSTGEIYNSYMNTWTPEYYLYDKSSLSISDSMLRQSLTSGLYIEIGGNSSLELNNVTFRYLNVKTPENGVSLVIRNSDFYYYKTWQTDAVVNSFVSASNISYIYVYGNGSYVFDTINLRATSVYLYAEGASWTFKNISYLYSPWTQITVGVNYNYEISNTLDTLLMNNDQLYAGSSRVLASSTRLSFDTVTLRDVGAYYSIAVTNPVVDYNLSNEAITLSGITATCNNTAHGILDNNKAVEHYYVIYDSASNEVLRGDLVYSGNNTWGAENVSVASLLPGTYTVVAYFADSDAYGQSAPVSFTVIHYISIKGATFEYDDALASLSVYGLHAYSSYAPFGELNSSEVEFATYQIINNDTKDVAMSGNLTWNGNSWEAMNVSTITIPAGKYFVRVTIKDKVNSENTANSTVFEVGSYFMVFGSRVSMTAFILGIVTIAFAAGIPIAVFLVLLKKGKLQNLFSKK